MVSNYFFNWVKKTLVCTFLCALHSPVVHICYRASISILSNNRGGKSIVYKRQHILKRICFKLLYLIIFHVIFLYIYIYIRKINNNEIRYTELSNIGYLQGIIILVYVTLYCADNSRSRYVHSPLLFFYWFCIIENHPMETILHCAWYLNWISSTYTVLVEYRETLDIPITVIYR